MIRNEENVEKIKAWECQILPGDASKDFTKDDLILNMRVNSWSRKVG